MLYISLHLGVLHEVSALHLTSVCVNMFMAAVYLFTMPNLMYCLVWPRAEICHVNSVSYWFHRTVFYGNSRFSLVISLFIPNLTELILDELKFQICILYVNSWNINAGVSNSNCSQRQMRNYKVTWDPLYDEVTIDVDATMAVHVPYWKQLLHLISCKVYREI